MNRARSADLAEPALTRATLTGLVGGLVMFLVNRLNREWTVFTNDELHQLGQLAMAASAIVAGVLIRRRVVPQARHDADVAWVEAAVYAEAIAPEPDPVMRAAPKKPSTKRR